MNVKDLISQMTLEEKAGLCSGDDFWHTKAVERLGIPRIMVSDGPYGLRKQNLKADHLGVNESIKAVCFPAGCSTACSFDKDLIYKMGQALGDECQAENVSVLLGPAANIKRSPLCGRNFEYFSEDPYLSGETASSYIKGVQSKNVGTSLKHFLANNQEKRRLTSSSNIDERTLREIYLASFEIPVKEAKPWTVMCSYNKVNDVQISENRHFLKEVLKDEWGFDGFVVSDWGAVNDRVKGLIAGLELEMPSSNGEHDKLIIDAVKNGTLDEKILDEAVEKILNIVFKYESTKKGNHPWDLESHSELSRKIEEECIVLLKNDNILPLSKESSVAFIGKFAEKPRYQGGGSSHINSFKEVSALEAVEGKQNVVYAPGYNVKEDVVDEALINEAVEAAKACEVAVIFAGLPDSFECEGYDRTHMSIPNCQNKLIEEVCKVQPNTVVVLHNGSAVEMPWINDVKGVVEAYLGGQEVGTAVVNVLYGDVNPSGKLAETFPLRLEDNPSYIFFGGEKDSVDYREGIFVGYRYYDKKKMDVLFPFGFGLSYTTFEYSNMKVDKESIKDTDTVNVTVDVTNTGDVFGKEVVQLYVRDIESTPIRPVRELKGYEKVALNPGETKTVSFTLNKRAFAYYNTEISDFYVESGEFAIEIGKSSRDIECTKVITVESTTVIKEVFNYNTTIGDLLLNPLTKETIEAALKSYEDVNKTDGDEENQATANEAITPEMREATFKETPLRNMVNFGQITIDQLNKLLNDLNAL